MISAPRRSAPSATLYVAPVNLPHTYELTHAQVWRLDLVFISIGWLSYVFKYLDQTNIVR